MVQIYLTVFWLTHFSVFVMQGLLAKVFFKFCKLSVKFLIDYYLIAMQSQINFKYFIKDGPHL